MPRAIAMARRQVYGKFESSMSDMGDAIALDEAGQLTQQRARHRRR